MRWQASVLAYPLAVVRDHPGNTYKGRAEALECWVRVYQKLMADPNLRALGRLCRRQYAHAAVCLANHHRGTGSYGRAFQTLLVSFTGRPADPSWWLALVKTCVRPLMPAAAMHVYRGVRAKTKQRS
jgi:hypothetical protein